MSSNLTIPSNATRCDNIPDADINGIGVLIAYLFGPYSLFILTVVLYACGRVPHHFLNVYDLEFVRIKPRSSARWVTGQAFLAFSIQQLVFGIAMLAAGFGTFRERTLFDFQTIIWTAWMSMVAHLITLLLLRDYCQSHMWARVLELGSMLVLMVMLCVALYPTTYWFWNDHLLIHDPCVGSSYCTATQMTVSSMWHEGQKAGVMRTTSCQAAINYMIILGSYLWQTTSLFQKRRSLLKRIFRRFLTWIGEAVAHVPAESGTGFQGLSRTIYRSILLGLYCYTLAVSWAIFSFAFRLWMLAVALYWGTMQLLLPRFRVLPPCSRSTLNQWSFGQILPMITLLSPVYGVLDYLLTKNTDPVHHPPTIDPQSVHSRPRPNRDKVSLLFKKLKQGDPAAQQTLHLTLSNNVYFTLLEVWLTGTAIFPLALMSPTFYKQTISIGGRIPYIPSWLDIVVMLYALTSGLMFAIVGPIFSKRLMS